MDEKIYELLIAAKLSHATGTNIADQIEQMIEIASSSEGQVLLMKEEHGLFPFLVELIVKKGYENERICSLRLLTSLSANSDNVVIFMMKEHNILSLLIQIVEDEANIELRVTA